MVKDEFVGGVKIDGDVAYLIGVFHSDGCIYYYNDKERKSLRLNLTVASKSLEMSRKFVEILSTVFNRTLNIRKIPRTNRHAVQTSVNKLKVFFISVDNYTLPTSIRDDRYLFGHYLAGLIDGDGYVKIQNNKDRTVPQCIIKVASDQPLFFLKTLVEKYLKCSVHFEFDARSKGVSTCFYVSKKNLKFIEEQLTPYIEISHKRYNSTNIYKEW